MWLTKQDDKWLRIYRNETLQLQVKDFPRVRERVQGGPFSVKPVTSSLSLSAPFLSSLLLPFLPLPPSSSLSSFFLFPPPSSPFLFSPPLPVPLFSVPVLFSSLRQVLALESRAALNLRFGFLNTIIIGRYNRYIIYRYIIIDRYHHSWLEMK